MPGAPGRSPCRAGAGPGPARRRALPRAPARSTAPACAICASKASTTGALASSPPVAVSTGSDRPAAAASRESARDVPARRHRPSATGSVSDASVTAGAKEASRCGASGLVITRRGQPSTAPKRASPAASRTRRAVREPVPAPQAGAEPLEPEPRRRPPVAEHVPPSVDPVPVVLEVAAERDGPAPRCDDGTGPHAAHGADEVGHRVTRHDCAGCADDRVHLPQHLVPVGEEEQPPHRPDDGVWALDALPVEEGPGVARQCADIDATGPDLNAPPAEHRTQSHGIPALHPQSGAADVDSHDDRHGGEPITSRTGPQPPPTTSRPEPRATWSCRPSGLPRSAWSRRGTAGSAAPW